jgi:hypothetical protein
MRFVVDFIMTVCFVCGVLIGAIIAIPSVCVWMTGRGVAHALRAAYRWCILLGECIEDWGR